MAGVAVVKPVVVVGHVINLVFIRIEVALAGVPIVVGRNSSIECAFYVEATVTLCLVATFVLTLEDVEIMTPQVLVISIETDTVFRMHHDAQVAKLYISAVAHQDTETVERGIIANTLDGEVHVLPLALYLQSDGGAA